MWNIFSGTIVNAIAVAVGSLLGLTIAKSLPERYRTIVLQCLGLMTITLAIEAGVFGFANTVAKYREGVSNPETYGARLGMIEGAVLGPVIDPYELREADPAALQARQLAGGRMLAATSIEPGQTLAFEAVVTTLPATAERFVLEPIPQGRAASLAAAPVD